MLRNNRLLERFSSIDCTFSFTAFFFTWIWALTKRLWLVALIGFLIGTLTPLSIIFYIISLLPPLLWEQVGSRTLSGFLINTALLLPSWSMQVFLGFYGVKLYRKKIAKEQTSKIEVDRTDSLNSMVTLRRCFFGLLLSGFSLYLYLNRLFPIH